MAKQSDPRLTVVDVRLDNGRYAVVVNNVRYDNNGNGYKTLKYARKIGMSREVQILNWLDSQKALSNIPARGLF